MITSQNTERGIEECLCDFLQGYFDGEEKEVCAPGGTTVPRTFPAVPPDRWIFGYDEEPPTPDGWDGKTPIPYVCLRTLNRTCRTWKGPDGKTAEELHRWELRVKARNHGTFARRNDHAVRELSEALRWILKSDETFAMNPHGLYDLTVPQPPTPTQFVGYQSRGMVFEFRVLYLLC